MSRSDDWGSPADAATAMSRLYGLLRVADITVAMPAAAIREVVPRPAALFPFPLTRPDLAGAIEVRGAIIPVIDMGLMLGLAPASAQDGIVAIVRDQGRVVGLLLDAIMGIGRLPEDAMGHLHYPDDAPLHRLATAGFLHGETRGIVLDPAQLSAMPGLPLVPDSLATRRQDEGGRGSERAADRGNCLLFRTGGHRVALDAHAIVATLPESALTVPPVDNDLWLGSLGWNGMAVPAVDTLRLIGLGSLGRAPGRCAAVVIHVDGHTAAGERACAALLIDGVDDIRQLPRHAPAALGTIGVSGTGAAHALVDVDGQPVLHLDPRALSADPRLVDVAAMQVPLGNMETNATAGEERSARAGLGTTDAWLTFRLGDSRYALPLAAVEAVLPGQQAMLPMAGQFPLSGVFLHRNRPTPVIDLAIRLGCARLAADDAAIMVVVDMEGQRRAFLADMLCSVERVPLQTLRVQASSRQLPAATIRCRANETWEVLGPQAFALAEGSALVA
jgi:purine-binding chemotaxis protein CheW